MYPHDNMVPRINDVDAYDDEIIVVSTIGQGPAGPEGRPATQAQVYQASSDFIEAHPEYVTTVMDGVITPEKLNELTWDAIKDQQDAEIGALLPKSAFSPDSTVKDYVDDSVSEGMDDLGFDMFLVMSRIIGEDEYPHIWLTNMQDIWIHCASLRGILDGDAWSITEIDGCYFITTAGRAYWTTYDFITFDKHYYPVFVLPNGSTTNNPIRAPKFHVLANGRVIFMFGYILGDIVNQVGTTVTNTYPVYYDCDINDDVVVFDNQYHVITDLPQTEGYMDADIFYDEGDETYYMSIKNERCLNTTFFKGASLSSMEEISWNNMSDVADLYLKGFEAGKLIDFDGELYAYDAAYSPRTVDAGDPSNESPLNCHFIRRALIKSEHRGSISNLLWEVVKSPAALRHPCYIPVDKVIMSNLVRSNNCFIERVNNYWLDNRCEHHNAYFRNNVNNGMVAFAPLPEASVRIRCAVTPVPVDFVDVNCDTVWYPQSIQIPVSMAGSSASYSDGFYYMTNNGFTGRRTLPRCSNFQHLTFDVVDFEGSIPYTNSTPYKIKSSKYKFLYGQMLES